MISQDKIDMVFMECYKRMFKESQPSGDIIEIIKSGEGKKPSFFMGYYLKQERQNKIIEDVCKEFKVPKKDQDGIKAGIVLGSAPSGNREATDKFIASANDFTHRQEKVQ